MTTPAWPLIPPVFHYFSLQTCSIGLLYIIPSLFFQEPKILHICFTLEELKVDLSSYLSLFLVNFDVVKNRKSDWEVMCWKVTYSWQRKKKLNYMVLLKFDRNRWLSQLGFVCSLDPMANNKLCLMVFFLRGCCGYFTICPLSSWFSVNFSV